MPTNISDLPVEVLLDHLLPILALQDLLALARTNKFIASVCQDDILWKLKLKRDFNFTANADTARESGFKVIYRGLRKPSVYTWGAAGQSRLGLSSIPKGMERPSDCVPFPAEVAIDARIVSMSFHALDDQGSIHVWGQLDGEGWAMNNDGFSDPAKTAKTPHKLHITMPSSLTLNPKDTKEVVRFTSVSCGRGHSAALDSNYNVWIFTRWGRPCLLTSDLINPKLSTTSHSSSSPATTSTRVIQVESGWDYVAMLTASGAVYAISITSPEDDFGPQLQAKVEELDRLPNDHHSRARADNKKVIHCTTIEIPAAPLLLPAIPQDLPELAVDADDGVKTELIRVAAGSEFLIGLTNKGHVLSIDLASQAGMAWLRGQFDLGYGGWVYHPEYTEVDRIRQDPVWAAAGQTSKPTAPKGSMRITHISAHFNTFVAYSISPPVVLMGTKSSAPNGTLQFPCNIIPSFHTRPPNDPIISVVLGDYHFVALTERGHVLSWGNYSKGALGLGDPRDLEVGAPGGFARIEEKEMAIGGRRNEPSEPVNVPSEVRFDRNDGKKGKKKFCYAVTASGWHTGALAIDLDYDDDEDAGASKGMNAEEFAAERGLFSRWNEDQEPYPQPQIGAVTPVLEPPGAFPREDHAEQRGRGGGRALTFESPPFNPNPTRTRGGPPYPMPTGPFHSTPVHPAVRPMPGSGRGGHTIPGGFPGDEDDSNVDDLYSAYQSPPFIPVGTSLPGGQRGHMPFRIGFAGRGAGLGRGGRMGVASAGDTLEFPGNPPSGPSGEQTEGLRGGGPRTGLGLGGPLHRIQGGSTPGGSAHGRGSGGVD
ncbi:hypothetical protein FRB97_006414 [Tulasnella sp. 331]|nr:hypothetical protein FRB97_006414 [Tulasnella sp. 331]